MSTEQTMTVDDVIALIGAIEQEEKVRDQLSVKRKQLRGAAEVIKHHMKRLAEREAATEQLENRHAHLQAELPALEKTYKRMQESIAGVKHEYQEKKAREEQGVTEVRAEREREEALSREIHQGLADLKARVPV